MNDDSGSRPSQLVATDRWAVSATGVWKRFPGTQALRDVAIAVRPGEIHALLGGNGSGKSTLVNILSGIERPDRGNVELDGVPHGPGRLSADAAHQLGLRVVPQRDATFAGMTVAENIAAGWGFNCGNAGPIRWSRIRRQTEAILDRFEIQAAPDQPIDELSPAVRRMVQIARALQDRDRAHQGVLILDEPTATLPDTETEFLLTSLRGFADDGHAIIYVTHRLDELVGFADRATVLRDGELVSSLAPDEVTRDRLVALIVGGEANDGPTGPEGGSRLALQSSTVPRLEVRDLFGGPLAGVTFSVYPGELVGLAGLMGSGRSSLLETILGAVSPRHGAILVDGADIQYGQIPGHKSVAYVPEDREHASFADLSVCENLAATSVRRHWKRLRLDKTAERRAAANALERYGIRTTSVDTPLAALSGGNQQKVALARGLEQRPSLLLLDEPTQGVDVKARAEIHALVRSAVTNGAAALTASSDFEELASISDRVLVLWRGRIIADLAGTDISPAKLGQLAFGHENP